MNIASQRQVYVAMRDAARSGHEAYVFEGIADTVLKRTTVSNLGWLLRHWREIHDIHVRMRGGVCMMAIRLEPHTSSVDHWRIYATCWADDEMLANWLVRPVLRGRPVFWNERAYIVGSSDYCKDLIPTSSGTRVLDN